MTYFFSLNNQELENKIKVVNQKNHNTTVSEKSVTKGMFYPNDLSLELCKYPEIRYINFFLHIDGMHVDYVKGNEAE